MRRSWRWWLAGLVSVLTFLVVTWVVTKYLPPSWLKDANQRLAVGCGAGTAAAALVALWGKTFAMAKDLPAESVPVSPRTVTVTGNNIGIASAGDRVRNIQGTASLPGTPPQASESPGRATGGEDADGAWVRIEGSNDGIASAGNDTTNIQEAR